MQILATHLANAYKTLDNYEVLYRKPDSWLFRIRQVLRRKWQKFYMT